MAALRNSDIPVQIVLATSGDSESLPTETDAVREQESRNAAEILGGADLAMWREQFLQLPYNERTIAMAMAAICEKDNDLVLAPSFHENHLDHHSMAWFVIEAARRVSTQRPALQVALYEVGARLHQVDALVDITPWLPLKESALRCFQSQMVTHEYKEQMLGLSRHKKRKTDHALEAFRILDRQALTQPVLLMEQESLGQGCLNFVSPMNSLPNVAILIRSLDRGTLSRALDSIALQSYPNIDIHILNVTGKRHRPVCDRAGRFPVFFHDPGVPVRRAAAANLLLDHAGGDFALFLDDDDWLAPDHINNLITMLEDHPEAAGAYADVEYGQLIHGEWKAERLFSASFDRNRLLFENYLPIHAVLFRHLFSRPDRGESAAPCRFDESLDLFEDWDFWLQLTSQDKLIPTNKVSAYYLHHNDKQSEVFEEGDLQLHTRDSLLDKWRQKIDRQAFIRLLDYLQSTYREKSTLQERILAMESNTVQQAEHYERLKAILFKRDKELANTKRHLKSLESVLKARVGEIQDAKEYAASLQDTLAARDQELMHAREYAASLQDTLAARDQELMHAREHAASLQDTLATRDQELMHAREHAASLTITLSARNQELLNFSDHTQALGEIIRARDEEIKNLHDHIAALSKLVAARDTELQICMSNSQKS